jgi:cytochrome c biogenesis protein CcmG/thiol:disulfide interchange protein DsbE
MLVDRAGHITWTDSVASLGWPSTRQLLHTIKLALTPKPAASRTASLVASPAPLAALHRQASRIVGAYPDLAARIRRLRGYPIVLNVWASWCTSCQSESNLLAAAAGHYGHQVAFLGVDADDSLPDARAFLGQHPTSYPSYSVADDSQLEPLAVIEGLPTTIYINSAGKVVDVHTGPYDVQGILDGDIAAYARLSRAARG